MTDFQEMREEALEKWEALTSTDIVIYIGAASCGHAAGVVKVEQAIEAYEKEKEVSLE